MAPPARSRLAAGRARRPRAECRGRRAARTVAVQRPAALRRTGARVLRLPRARASADEPLSQPGTRAVPAAAPSSTRSDAGARRAAAGRGRRTKSQIAESLGPAQILSAYGLTGATPPSTQKIALVDAYDDRGAEADLESFGGHFGLPACNEANHCFRKVNQRGESTSLPFPTTPHQLKLAREGNAAEREEAEAAAGWADEIATDVEVAHGVCPSCEILLVEANTNENKDLYTAEQTAAKLGANEISNSYGGEEPGLDYPRSTIPAS